MEFTILALDSGALVPSVFVHSPFHQSTRRLPRRRSAAAGPICKERVRFTF